MSRSIRRSAARRLSLAFALVALAGFAACADAPTDPARDGTEAGTIESIAPRLDGGDTTDTGWCGHTQGWDC